MMNLHQESNDRDLATRRGEGEVTSVNEGQGLVLQVDNLRSSAPRCWSYIVQGW
jgi:hypothetical protein